MIRNPADFGPIGAGNDTAAFNAALAAIRADTHGTLHLPTRTYNLGVVNATGIWSLEIQAEPNTVLEGSKLTQPATILDCNGTRSRIVGDLTIRGPSAGNPLGWVMPTGGLLVCNSDRTHIDGLKSDGQFSAGALAIVAASSVNLFGGQLINYHASGPCLMVSATADWGINSAASIPYSPNVSDVYFHGVEIHGLGPSTQQCTTYMRNADHVAFVGGIHDASNGKTSHMWFEGTCDRITVSGVKMYAEVGAPASYVYRSTQGSCSHLRHYNSSYPGIADSNLFTGSFPGFSVT